MDTEVKRLAADLAGAGPKARKRSSQAVAKGAFDLEGASRPFARVDTGALRNSIGSDITELRAVVGPTVHYAPHQEYGTRFQSGTHYMSRGADIVEPGFIAAIAQAGADPIVSP